jgi:ankyrin repeat protein
MDAVDAFQAIRRDGADAIKALTQLPATDVKNADGAGLLHTAIAHRNRSAIGARLNSGIDFNSPDARGQTPLHYAAASGGRRPNVFDRQLRVLSNNLVLSHACSNFSKEFDRNSGPAHDWFAEHDFWIDRDSLMDNRGNSGC